jgi:hypothetical protein
MAEPARRSAAGPGAPGWGEYRRKMMAAAQDVTAAVVAYLAAGGGDDSPPAAMAALAIGIFQDQGAVARRLDVGEAVIEAERRRAVEEDRALVPRPRGHHLRAVT